MKDFCGFRFGNIHSEELHLVVVSSSNRYEKNLLPDATDYTTDVPGGNGKYYFGQTHGTREFKIEVAFDSVSEPIFRKISQLFANDKLQDLVFDEMPFKTYRAKIQQKPDFKFICFTNRESGERIYKGEGTLNFICYFPYAFGFNKYIVRAADYYNCLSPENIIKYATDVNPYRQPKEPKFLPGLIKDHYNVRPNMNMVWKGGYPSIQQVQQGELYFNPPPEDRVKMPLDCSSEASNKNKLLIDVRGYFKNIPEWQGTAKLLTSPTLDYDQELIYLPQYSKQDYINMDTGSAHNSNLVGSRILVYNPGDLPVDFELRIGNLMKEFRGQENYTFRVSRHNVERLTLEQAVDWTGMTTFKDEDNQKYKYGSRYFTIMEGTDDTKVITETKGLTGEERKFYEPAYRNLKIAHPNHAYLVEPIPRERLGHFIRLFYWQSCLLNKDDEIILQIMDFEKGKQYAGRYEELYSLCISEDEQYELYWKTLKEAILDRYKELDNAMDGQLFPKEYPYERFVYDFIHHPSEYIRVKKNENAKYGQFELNINNYPQFISEEYFDISTKDLEDFVENDNVKHSTIQPLFLDTERRMLYNIIEPKWEDNNNELYDNFYNYKPSKNILNENIEKGHWFKLPPGWSLINITPVVDEDIWGGKRWIDARPFDWGWGAYENDSSGENNKIPDKRILFDTLYEYVVTNYLLKYCPSYITENSDEAFVQDNGEKVIVNGKINGNPKLYEKERIFQIRRWYEDYRENINKIECAAARSFGDDIYKKRTEVAEVRFLRTLDTYWKSNFSTEPFEDLVGETSEWWWYSNNYIWANYPPLYWGYIDLLNQIEIKYTPLFY